MQFPKRPITRTSMHNLSNVQFWWSGGLTIQIMHSLFSLCDFQSHIQYLLIQMYPKLLGWKQLLRWRLFVALEKHIAQCNENVYVQVPRAMFPAISCKWWPCFGHGLFYNKLPALFRVWKNKLSFLAPQIKCNLEFLWPQIISSGQGSNHWHPHSGVRAEALSRPCTPSRGPLHIISQMQGSGGLSLPLLCVCSLWTSYHWDMEGPLLSRKQ